jgi:hypothetical protein
MLVLFMGLYSSPLTYSEIDLDNNGFIDFSEFTYGTEIGNRAIVISEMQCTEYYHLKDGLPAAIKCK